MEAAQFHGYPKQFGDTPDMGSYFRQSLHIIHIDTTARRRRVKVNGMAVTVAFGLWVWLGFNAVNIGNYFAGGCPALISSIRLPSVSIIHPFRKQFEDSNRPVIISYVSRL